MGAASTQIEDCVSSTSPLGASTTFVRATVVSGIGAVTPSAVFVASSASHALTGNWPSPSGIIDDS